MGNKMIKEFEEEQIAIDPQAITLQHARVVSVSGKHVLIDTLLGPVEEARVAFSCLVQPMPDDLVLCSKSESGDYYILNILERSNTQNMTLAFSGDTTLHSGGELTAVSCKSISMIAAENMNCISKQVVHKSNNAVIDYAECTAKGNALQVSFNTIKTISQLMTDIVNQYIGKMKSYIRHTESYDQIKAGQMSRKADGVYTMDSSYTIMVSKKDTKIDGERIHMG
jgi:hypothetical protein